MSQRMFDRALLMLVAAGILALVLYGIASLWMAAHAERPAAADPLSGAGSYEAGSTAQSRS